MKYFLPIVLVIVVIAGALILFKRYERGNIQSSQNMEVAGNNSSGNASGNSSEALAKDNQINLNISYPTEGLTVGSPNITVKGKTVPAADIFVNDDEGKADANGNFAIRTTLDEGDNTLLIVANDNNGNSSEQDLNVTYDSGQ